MKEINIGNQIWMAENLSLDHFQNGDLIGEAKSIKEWEDADMNGIPAWCHYDNNDKNGEIYGKLYNWHAVIDPRNLAPKNWHIPKDEEWEILSLYCGGNEHAGKKLKSSSGWVNNEDIIDNYGFCGLPGGVRLWYFKFQSIGEYGCWWSSSEYDDFYSWHRLLISDYDLFGRINNGGKGFGMSVRCIKNSY